MPNKDIFKATLKNENLIEIMVSKKYHPNGCRNFYLYSGFKRICELKVSSKTDNSKHNIYLIENFPELKLGSDYRIYDDRNIYITLDCSYLNTLDKYVRKYNYLGELGAIYTKKKTTFRVFSPIATEMAVSIYLKDGSRQLVNMIKDVTSGVFEGIAVGDFDGCAYTYIGKVNGEIVEANDPYAKGITTLSDKSVIINEEKAFVDLNRHHLPRLNTIKNAVIYEFDVRDMTSQNKTSIKNKGKFLGLTERGVKTINGNPVGIDYIKSLGVTHVQILPMFDFCTINDLYPNENYNWGYDPLNYNVPEGSYSTDPSDPYSRIKEAKMMVSEFHKLGIRVIMDVVFNHVFNMETSSFEILCPKYYFRYNDDGTISNGSFCGNEFESRHNMGRKFIVDSCKYWVKEYGIDGFRVDLMGLIDVDTINLIKEECTKLNKNFVLYGEGWDMPTVLKQNQKSIMANAKLTPSVSYFNDRFRDTVKGSTGNNELYIKGYLTGDINYRDGFKHVFSGSCIPVAFPPLFSFASQSINYVECHDNSTLYDKLVVSNYDDNENDRLKRINLINASLLLSNGISLIHMGQEIGLSKGGNSNSYNSGDLINQFKYDILDRRIKMYNFFKQAVELKKSFTFFENDDTKSILKMMKFVDLDNGGLEIDFNSKGQIEPYSSILILINPTKEAISVEKDDYYQIIFNETGLITTPLYEQRIQVNGISLVVAVKK